jgi:hypothetical protein
MSDQPRFLSRGGVPGYVSYAGAALPGEGEAVPLEVQEKLTEEAHRKALDARVKRREATSEEIEREIEHLDARGRYLRRELKRLQRVPS